MSPIASLRQRRAGPPAATSPVRRTAAARAALAAPRAAVAPLAAALLAAALLAPPALAAPDGPVRAAPARAAPAAGCRAGPADDERPYWARQRAVTVLVDSVLLGAVARMRTALACRRFDVRGRPALMLAAAERELRGARRVAPLVVVGLGYNSLWERGRRRYRQWAARFDREATRLVRTLRRRGARQLVWVTLREPRARDLTAAGRAELGRYSWYFPYVNERLRALARRRSDVALADWAAVSRRRGLTYDSIHLTPAGALLMARTIGRAIDAEARRQVRARRARPV